MAMDLARVGGKVADTLIDGVTYTIIVVRLASASLSMFQLSEAVRGAFNYVEGCAKSVMHLADTASGLKVDPAVVGAHQDAATVMRGVLADAEDLSTEAAEMASDFRTAKDEHEADYGPVAEAMAGKETDRTYYSSR